VVLRELEFIQVVFIGEQMDPRREDLAIHAAAATDEQNGLAMIGEKKIEPVVWRIARHANAMLSHLNGRALCQDLRTEDPA
jgi:hypothetical protein